MERIIEALKRTALRDREKNQPSFELEIGSTEVWNSYGKVKNISYVEVIPAGEFRFVRVEPTEDGDFLVGFRDDAKDDWIILLRTDDWERAADKVIDILYGDNDPWDEVAKEDD